MRVDHQQRWKPTAPTCRQTIEPMRHRAITISRGDALAGLAIFAAIAIAALI